MKKIKICMAVLALVLTAMFAIGCGGVNVEAGTYQLVSDSSVKITVSYDDNNGKIAFEGMDRIFASIEDAIAAETNKVEPKYQITMLNGKTIDELDIKSSISDTFASTVQGTSIEMFVNVEGVTIQAYDETWKRDRIKNLDLRFVYDTTNQTITLDLTDLGQGEQVFEKI